MRSIWLIRCIGFQQQELDRHRRDDPPQSRGPLVSDRTTDAEAITERPQLPGLLFATGKTVHDAAHGCAPAQRHDHLVDRAACMHDHRQAGVARDFELGMEITALQLRIEPFDKMVEPAFADRDRPLAPAPIAREPLSQQIQMFRPMFSQNHWMQSISRMQAGIVRADRS